MRSVERTSLPDQVFRHLVADVLSGRYAPGERLPAQRALAAELGVNMASVREGVKRLEQLRLVDVRQGDAMRVRDWRAYGGLDVLVHALGATREGDVLRSVLEARRLLLTEAARLAAQRRDASQADLLATLAAQVAAAADDTAAQGTDFAFFATIIEAAGNLVFSLIANSIRELYFQQLEAFRALVADRVELAPLYERAARAIEARDGDGAAAAVAELAGAQQLRMLGGTE
jgi:GntR family transcriptional regulator, transcriptional repressor for pyruvate dehydrogenase complex